MMSAGFFMMGFGLIAMLLVVILPIVLIGGLVWAFSGRSNPLRQEPAAPGTPVPTGRVCSHCGAGLQNGWTYCARCGAPVS